MKKEKIGEIFVKIKLISPAQLDRVLQENRAHPEEKLGQTLVRLKLASDIDIARALSLQLNTPYIDLHTVVIDPSAVKRIPLNIAMQHQILGIYLERNNLILAMAIPQDFEAIEAARFASGLNIRPHVAPLGEILAAINRYYAVEESVGAMLQDATPSEEVENLLEYMKLSDQQLQDLKKQSESPAIVKMVNTIMLQGISMRATAIQVDPQEREVVIKNRVDGALVESMRTPQWTRGALISRLKLMGGLDLVKRHIPQKGRTKMKMLQRVIEMEISSLPARFGESITIHILDTGESLPLVKDLGLLPEDVQKIQKLLWLPQGLILGCGSHGSGQAALLYTLANELAQQHKKIVTIDETIAYQLKGAQQVQINAAAGLTFPQALQSVLRQKPDVILVGEIRDSETAELTLQAATNGRLMLSTLGAPDVIATILRFKELGVDPRLLATALAGMVTQRQVRKICDQCRAEYAPPPRILERIAAQLGEKVTGAFSHGKGCDACNQTGYRDQSGVYHVIMLSPGLRQFIRQDTTQKERRASFSKIESTLLMQTILAKAKERITTVEELERVLFPAEPVAKAEEVKCPQCRQPLPPGRPVCPHCQPARPTPAAPRGEQLPPPATVAPAPEKKDSRYAFKGFKILLVDNDPDVLQRVGRTLLEKQLTVTTATDGAEAWAQIVRDKPHLVITDVALRKMDGLELIRRLRREQATAAIPVIIVSAKHETADRIKGFAVGTDDYVSKPFSMQELFFRINAIFRRVYK